MQPSDLTNDELRAASREATQSIEHGLYLAAVYVEIARRIAQGEWEC